MSAYDLGMNFSISIMASPTRKRSSTSPSSAAPASAANEHGGDPQAVVMATVHAASEVDDGVVEDTASAFLNGGEGLRHLVGLHGHPPSDGRKLLVAAVLRAVVVVAFARAEHRRRAGECP